MSFKQSLRLPVGIACGALLAHASLIITPTFDPTITTDAGAAGIEGAINAAIAAVEGNVTSPHDISVGIYFTEMSGGLGQSTTDFYSESYFNYYNALKAVATQPDQLAALASLGPAPSSGTGNPVNGLNVLITSAEGRNLGFNTPGGVTAGSGTYDTEIQLNTSITSPPGPSSGYGLQAVANHEIDESLGIGGPGSMIGGTGFFATGVGDLDLYRYTAPGVRSFSAIQATTPYSYFSIDGGNTVLTYFNQTAGADYADWLSNPIPAGFNPQLQDAFGARGTNPPLGANEIIALNAIGYAVTAPEPSNLLLAGLALGLGYFFVRRSRATA